MLDSIPSRPRVAFVVQAYGPHLEGGLERHTRLIAEHLCRFWDVEVLTSCARDFRTWRNEEPPGLSEINGVTVRRFPVDRERDPEAFRKLTDHILQVPPAAGSSAGEARSLDGPRDGEAADQEEWMREQGPYSSPLLDFLGRQAPGFAMIVFCGYLYATTYFGIQRAGPRAVLLPAAHDEPMLRLSIFQKVFAAARFFIFNSPEERALLQKVADRPLRGLVCGVDCGPVPVLKACNDEDRGPHRPYLLYIGRVDHPKGCGELLSFFENAGPQIEDVHLYLAGRQLMEVPSHPRIHALGYVSEERKFRLLRNALALVMPSPYESLSLVLLESWKMGVPVLANGRCNVLKGQCHRSGGGLTYTDLPSFRQGVCRLLDSRVVGTTMGLRGHRYARRAYSWSRVRRCYFEGLQDIGRQVRGEAFE